VDKYSSYTILGETQVNLCSGAWNTPGGSNPPGKCVYKQGNDHDQSRDWFFVSAGDKNNYAQGLNWNDCNSGENQQRGCSWQQNSGG
jgi:hypothetical protein